MSANASFLLIGTTLWLDEWLPSRFIICWYDARNHASFLFADIQTPNFLPFTSGEDLSEYADGGG